MRCGDPSRAWGGSQELGWALHGPQGLGGDGQSLSFPILPSRGPSKDQSSLQAMMR